MNKPDLGHEACLATMNPNTEKFRETVLDAYRDHDERVVPASYHTIIVALCKVFY